MDIELEKETVMSLIQRGPIVIQNITDSLDKIDAHRGWKNERKFRKNIWNDKFQKLYGGNKHKPVGESNPPPAIYKSIVDIKKSNKPSKNRENLQTQQKGQQQEDNEFVIPQTGNIKIQISESQDIPPSRTTSSKVNDFSHLFPQQQQQSYDLQAKLLSSGPPLEAYKNFVRKHHLNSQQKYETQNPFKSIEFWLLDILYENAVEIVFDMKRNFIKGDFQYIEKLLLEAQVLKQYGGDDINEQVVKKLFVECIYRKQDDTSIKLIEQFSILEPIIELAMVYHIVCSLSPDQGQAFLQLYRNDNKNLFTFYSIIAKVFEFTLDQLSDKRYVFKKGDKCINVKIKSQDIFQSWIM